MESISITSIPSDTTKILPCRKGDILAWVQDSSSIWTSQSKYEILDLWVMNDGATVLLSNRFEDIPEWFPLTPTMVGGLRNCRKMVEKLNSGYVPNSYGLDIDSLENSWKVNVWNYVIWSGENRPDITDCKGILGIFRFETGSLVLNQDRSNNELGEDSSRNYDRVLTSQRGDEIKGAFDFIVSQGKARKYAEEWKLG